MDTNCIDPLLKSFVLNQRNINCWFRKDTGINRTNLEILMFGNTLIAFNPYQVQKTFPEMNLQQVRLGIRKLLSIGAIELWQAGVKNRPAVYMITKKGKHYINQYNNYWSTCLK